VTMSLLSKEACSKPVLGKPQRRQHREECNTARPSRTSANKNLSFPEEMTQQSPALSSSSLHAILVFSIGCEDCLGVCDMTHQSRQFNLKSPLEGYLAS
jgi:hypothetical protein